MVDAPYTLDSLQLSGFRAYLEPKIFDFGTKRCLAVFAPNASGKSSLVDALEFMFSDEGTLERLGVRAIHNNAGVTALAHNLATEKNIPSCVSVRFKREGKKQEGSRVATGTTRPRPPIAETVKACFAVDPIIRGHALRRFVEEQKAEKRYEDVARWLQLDPLVDVQRNLRTLRRSTKADAEDTTALKRVDTQVTKKSGSAVKTWDDAAVLACANNLLNQLDPTLTLKSVDQADTAINTVRERANAEGKRLGLEGLRQVRRAATVLYEKNDDPDNGNSVAVGLFPEFVAAVEAQTVAEEVEAKERNAAANAAFEELWKRAESLFAEGMPIPETCPICTTPISTSRARSVEGVRTHIATHLTELAGYAKAKKVLENAKSNVNKVRTQLVAALKALPPLLPEVHAAIQTVIAAHLIAVESWKGGAAPDASKLNASLHELTTALDASITEIESKQGDNTYIKTLNKLEELIDLKHEHETEVRKLAELEKLTTALNAQAAFISGEIRKKVQTLLDILQTPINEIYRQIQGAGASPVRLELPSEDDTNQQRLNLVIDFAPNRASVQPGGYLSDSQIHSLSLALRLAAIKRFNTSAPIIALDDIVTSYDADHRRTIAGLLAKMFV